MRHRKSYFLTLFLLALLVATGVTFWLVLPEPMTRNLPEVAKIVRRVILVRSNPEENMGWTATDRMVQGQLEELIAGREPPMKMVLNDGREMNGRVIRENAESVEFARQLGLNGEMTMAVSRDRIVSLQPRKIKLPEITLRDVRFYRDWPDKQFYKLSPFTVITKESYSSVKQIIEQQRALYDRFTTCFVPLINEPRKSGIQLLILSDPDEFELCRIQSDGVGKGSAGFYNLQQDRLIVLHQRNADWVKEGRRQIDDAAKKYRPKMKTEAGLNLLERWKEKARARLNAQAGMTTRNILRHEGTHQLCYSFGVLNKLETSRGWISEGLATWFETERPGAGGESRIRELKNASEKNKLKTLRQLMTLKHCVSGLDYAQAWALTDLLMQPEYRPGFFAYLAQVRQFPQPSADPVEELCGFLSIGPQEFQRRWLEHIRTKI